MKLTINGKTVELDAEPDMPLLWALRDMLGLRGTKYACGMGVCGSCTVHLDGEAVRSCQLTLEGAAEGEITTIEGLSEDGSHPLQVAWREHNVPQCGYCQPGQIMSASALLAANAAPSDTEINNMMAGNLCRCGTYPRIRAAIKSTFANAAAAPEDEQ
ncbi:(2Fe-2S)-binding protein [Kineobactrum sediminis]|uniref:(2Fe-2S)-binding protein n=1 Tax=Kineobactrum sediminis TaxID=1905677 RepID=A0A2N5Y3R5_9GAMM|nr:(2Fe-2S)-binding protein [Kineobactrum sediminis]PLW83040.1 (2Fe-2S)-binding protein [Kineobactrum sediminis]